jgi:hypothetical protein
MLTHHSIHAFFFFSALKRYMTCHAIYWQKARTKSKDIGGSDSLTGGCVCQRVKYICIKSWLCGNVRGMFGVLSAFGHWIMGWYGYCLSRSGRAMWHVTTVRSSHLLAPVTNWEHHGIMLAGYCYVMRHGMKVSDRNSVSCQSLATLWRHGTR